MYPSLHWSTPLTVEPRIYLTFDDGPTPGVTDIVLEKLQKADAKGTFFCLGNNIKKHPQLFEQLLTEGHKVGNHTCNHLNGWTTTTEDYVHDIMSFDEIYKTNLFRPPYGRIKSAQIKAIVDQYKIIMWSVLTRDYDDLISKEKALEITMKHLKPGAIVVFHDSLKAKDKMLFLLDKVLEVAREREWKCSIIE
jgi:peptidoglycan/xylan/chitin deacetylase (PgdA/CDA1 family)